MTAAQDRLDALLAHAEAADEPTRHYRADLAGWYPNDELRDLGFSQRDAAFIAACDPGTIRALVQRVKDAEAETRRVIEHVEGADELADEAVAERDDLLTALTALADTADRKATDDLGNLNDSGRVVPLGLVPTREIRDLIHDHGGTT